MAGLKLCFEDFQDPRVVGRCNHLLIDTVTVSLFAVLCGAEGFSDIEEFGKRRRDWLQELLELPEGILSHDTFRRVLGALDRKQFAADLFERTKSLHEATDSKLIAIDGRAILVQCAKSRDCRRSLCER